MTADKNHKDSSVYTRCQCGRIFMGRQHWKDVKCCGDKKAAGYFFICLRPGCPFNRAVYRTYTEFMRMHEFCKNAKDKDHLSSTFSSINSYTILI